MRKRTPALRALLDSRLLQRRRAAALRSLLARWPCLATTLPSRVLVLVAVR